MDLVTFKFKTSRSHSLWATVDGSHYGSKTTIIKHRYFFLEFPYVELSFSLVRNVFRISASAFLSSNHDTIPSKKTKIAPKYLQSDWQTCNIKRRLSQISQQFMIQYELPIVNLKSIWSVFNGIHIISMLSLQRKHTTKKMLLADYLCGLPSHHVLVHALRSCLTSRALNLSNYFKWIEQCTWVTCSRLPEPQ
jgi:hypothetical protein